MKRVTLYSSSRRSRSPVLPSGTRPSDRVPPRLVRLWKSIRRHDHALWAIGGGLLALLLVWGYATMAPTPHRITQKDIERAVLHTLETGTLPSPAAKAYEAIRPSVVRIRGMDTGHYGDDEIERSVGSGVVIVDKGVILTNLHVVAGAAKVKVVFADGLESES